MAQPDIKNINKEIAKGSAWTVFFRVIEKIISIFSTIILARLLVPQDFGIVAIAMMVVALLELMQSFGFENALIQNQNADRHSYDTVWTFKIITGLLMAVSLYLISPYAADFFNEPRLSFVLKILSIGVLVSGFENIGVIAFRKEMKFRKDFNYMVVKKLVSFFCTISLALYFKNFWALIIGSIITNVFAVTYSYFVHPYRPSLSLTKARELSSFSTWLFINNLLLFAMQKIPQAVIGKLTSPAQLGVFTLSRDITYATTTAIVMPINRAAFPGYSKLNGDITALKNSFLSTLSMIALIIIPTGAGISAIAPLMVPVMLGNQWLSSIPIMQILGFSGLLFAMANVNAVYLALGKPYLMTRITMVRLCIYIPSMIYGTLHFGVLGTAWSLLITGILILPTAYYPAARILNISLRDFILILYRPALAALLMYTIVATAIQYMPPELTYMTQSLYFIALIVIGAIVYPVSVSLLWLFARKPESAEFHILELIQRKIYHFTAIREK